MKTTSDVKVGSTMPSAPHSDPWQEVGAAADGAIAEQPSLTSRTASGFSWLFGQTAVLKVVSLAGQIVLAWLLSPTAFGAYAVALTVSSFIGLLQNLGLREMLVQRHREFERWANAATWMAATAGVASFLIALTISLLIFPDTQLGGLLVVLGAATPFVALQTVPTARLQTQFRFGTIAVIGLSAGLSYTCLSITLAYYGFGAYSLALPRLIVAALQTGALFAVAAPRIRAHPQFRRWRFLARDAGFMLATSLCITATLQADYAVLALLHDEYVVGVYYFAFGLAMQPVQMLAQNLANAFLPALSALQDDRPRQISAFFRATRMISFVAVPMCIIQAALAGPIIRALFDPRWIPAIPVFAALSVGVVFLLMGSAAASLFQSQGRFNDYWRWSLLSAILLVACATVGATLGGAFSTAAAVSFSFVISGPAGLYLAARGSGGTWRDVMRVYVPPLCAAAIAIGLPMYGIRVIGWPMGDWSRIVLVAGAAALLYFVLALRLMPDEIAELSSRFFSGHAAPPAQEARTRSTRSIPE
jgi:PST family polysaccharide transporter